MADYDKYIGGNTTLRIRDTGTDVEFWVKTGSSTFNNQQDWSRKVNNVFARYTRQMVSGGNWQKFGEAPANYSQTVYFTIYDAGLGFPTYTHSAYVSRSTVPDPPGATKLTRGSNGTSVTYEFEYGGDGGSAIDGARVGYSSTSDQPYVWVSGSGPLTITGLTPGKTYYFWSQTHNKHGYSEYGPRTSVTMLDYPTPASSPPALSDVEQTTLTATVYDGSSSGSTILERELSWGTSPTTSSNVSTSTGTKFNLTGLSPGVTYYFWSRTRNTVGWSDYSPRGTATTVAGAWVRQNGVWKKAIPYVRTGGVWKMARPWVRSAGVWKETST